MRELRGGMEIGLKLRGGRPAESGVGTDGVVEGFQVSEHLGLRHGAGGVLLEMDEFAFETAEEIFGDGVVIGIAPAGHALADAVGVQTLPVGSGGVLDAAVAVEDPACGGGTPCPAPPASVGHRCA